MQANNYLPWLNYSLIEFLQHHITQEMDIFEYGIGFSTGFFAQRARFVYGIESRPEWIKTVSDFEFTNIEVKLCTELKYFPDEIHNFSVKKFDAILIDSRDRIKCLIKSCEYLKSTGIIILDNTEREKLAIQAKTLMNAYKTLYFEGCGPNRDGISSAMVFSNFA